MSAKVGKKSNRGSKPGERRGGRQKGTPNRITKTVREAILGAFDELGGQKWLVKLGKNDEKAFASLLGKVLPTQLTGADGGPIMVASSVALDFSGIPEEELDRRLAQADQGRKAPKAPKA